MIFGFNTDIKHEGTVYHVQSEAREGEMLLQTQVFVRGRCIGKRATPYAERANSPDFTDQKKEQILREQHRLMLDAIRDGRLQQALNNGESSQALAAINEVDIQWLNSDSIHSEEKLSIRLRATEAGAGIPSARLTVRLACAHAHPFYAQAETDGSGEAHLLFSVDESSLYDLSVLVQVNSEGRIATRKFQLRKLEL